MPVKTAKVCAAIIIIELLCLSYTAMAQSVGTYGGQQANGQPISIEVARYKGNLIVNIVNFGQVTVECQDGTTIYEAEGVGGAEPIKNGSGHFGLNFGPIYIHMSYRFDDATHSVSGFFQQDYGLFRSVASGSPKKATFCPSGNIAFAAVRDADVKFNPNVKFRHHGCSAADGGNGPCTNVQPK